MSELFTIEQKQGLSNRGTQIGVQNNYGLSVDEAMKMAFQLFKEYYPQLREEALKSLEKLLEEKLSNIPNDCIISPSPRIVVPALQNASITDEQEVRELYANLLANSMNITVKDGVHPGYVEIIKQLTSDEAKLLNYIANNGLQTGIPSVSLNVFKEDGSTLKIMEGFTNACELCGCEKPEDYGKYIDNLERLGLIKRKDNEKFINDSVYSPLINNTSLLEIKRNIEARSDVKKVDFIEGVISLTYYGIHFCEICI